MLLGDFGGVGAGSGGGKNTSSSADSRISFGNMAGLGGENSWLLAGLFVVVAAVVLVALIRR